jgi:hypothetical protein
LSGKLSPNLSGAPDRFHDNDNPDHTSTLSTVNNLANLYRDQGKPANAEQIYVRALAGYEKALGPDHTLTLDTVNNLGGLPLPMLSGHRW